MLGTKSKTLSLRMNNSGLNAYRSISYTIELKLCRVLSLRLPKFSNDKLILSSKQSSSSLVWKWFYEINVKLSQILTHFVIR